MPKNILDVFYNILIKEASLGNVDCFFRYNMRFDTKLVEEDALIAGGNDNSNLIVPTLMIKNKKEFDELLVQYVDLALNFYDENNYPEEVRESKYFEDSVGISKEKLIMTLLWSNATIEDFNNPCNFLRKRIAFFELNNLEEYLKEQFIGYSEMLKSDIIVKVEKNKLENETPYGLKIFLADSSSKEKIYEFPKIYFGLDGKDVYVYAIQNDRNRLTVDKYAKKIDRVLYKVNEGLDVKNDNYDNYQQGNLKDITPNALVGMNIFMGLLKNKGISKVKVPSILISRWNAKMILLDNKRNLLTKKKVATDEIDKMLEEYEQNYLYIQSNLTEKFLRVFRRIGYHHSTMMISSYNYELDSHLFLSILDGEDVCNNKLLDETYKLLLNRELEVEKRKSK